MTAMPKSILEEVGRMIYPSKSCEYKVIRNRFAMHGYGPQKIDKWMVYYTNCEIITENSDGTVSCAFW